MESKLQVSDKGDLLDFSLDGGIASQGNRMKKRALLSYATPPPPEVVFGLSVALHGMTCRFFLAFLYSSAVSTPLVENNFWHRFLSFSFLPPTT